METKVITIGSVEVARMLGVDRKTVLNYVRKGIIPAQKLPSGTLRYDYETIKELSKRWSAERTLNKPE